MKYLEKLNILSLLFIGFLLFTATDLNAQSAVTTKTEKTLDQKIKSRILKLPRYEVFDHIAFRLDGGTVTLSGKVLNGVNKSGAEHAIKNLPGVEKVVNQIEILPPGSFDDSIRRNLYYSLANTGLSQYLWETNPDVRLIVDRGHVTLEGTVRGKGDYNLFTIRSSGLPGVFSVTNNLVLKSKKG